MSGRAKPKASSATRVMRFSGTLGSLPGGSGALRLDLPPRVSSALPSRGMVAVEGTLEGATFRAVLRPDGRGGHWLKVGRSLRARAGLDGAVARVELQAAAKDPEPRVPADLRHALSEATPEARATWKGVTPVARRDWVQWIESAKQESTRARRIVNACEMLTDGKRRPCCFDRSGMYGSLSGRR